MIDKKLIEKILDGYPGTLSANVPHVAEWVATELKVVGDIRSELEKLRREGDENRKRFDLECKAIQDRVEVIWRKCRHDSTTHHPGPQNGDSYTDCNICGKVIS